MSKSEENFALKVINESLKLPFVKVKRSEFLIKMFGDQISDKNLLLDKGPQEFFTKEELDKKAQSRINVIVAQSSSISFATGIPGGLAMAATIPADIAQFYAYSLKLAQEISYIYGYEDIWNDQDELSEDAKNTLILYLGIMLGVTSAGSAIRVLSSKLSVQAMKKIPQKALTKTFYYPIIKKVLAVFGTKLTKASFAKGVSKTIPVVGGVLSGSINYFSMKPMAIRLKNELGKSVNYNHDELNRDLKILKDEDVEIINSTSDVENTTDVFEQIEKAHELLAKNMITEEEFNELKKNILSKI
ncbi:SHOCT domain-containing protein [Enterococcus italicus]|uniref:SHOCT domain-containing protein n=1 Tax=Enterococcus italicus TaxID=246144 RepID=UPI002073C9BB|nr:SHOCT domain-containing protein [Enterococcus italicus]